MLEDPSAQEDEEKASLVKGLHDALTEDDQAARKETRNVDMIKGWQGTILV